MALMIISSGCSGGDDDTNGSFTTVPITTMNQGTTVAETTVDTGDDTTAAGSTTSGVSATSETTSVDPTTSGDPSSTSSTTDVGSSTSADASSSGTTAPPPGCGNAVLDPLEECDDGNDVETDDCTSMCLPAACGDGFIHAGVETCDDGMETKTCNADCSAAMCGDKIVNVAAGETCDDGMESAACDKDCSAAMCGDMAVNAAAGETCDDGNAVDTDACVAGCKLAACGDKLVQAGVEDCDDGNMVNGDGCENTCKKSPLPAECVNAVLLSDAFRNVSNINGAVGCDNPWTTQWYRFTGAAGIKMPTVAPPSFACGTHASGWINGKDPTVNEGAVARTVCFNWNGNTCNWSEPVTVRNCGDYYVYFLKNVSWGCSGRYCGTN